LRILGIDFGEKRIGLAVSDPLGLTAQGIETLPNKGPAKVTQALASLCKNYEVEEIVIGLPVNMNGSFGSKANAVLSLVPDLEKALKVPIKTWDERLTSVEVNRLMAQGGLSEKRQRQNTDRLVATLILQSYLESKRR